MLIIILKLKFKNISIRESESEIIKWYKNNNNEYASKRHAEVYDSRILDWQVCHYCKRKIKEGK